MSTAVERKGVRVRTSDLDPSIPVAAIHAKTGVETLY